MGGFFKTFFIVFFILPVLLFFLDFVNVPVNHGDIFSEEDTATLSLAQLVALYRSLASHHSRDPVLLSAIQREMASMKAPEWRCRTCKKLLKGNLPRCAWCGLPWQQCYDDTYQTQEDRKRQKSASRAQDSVQTQWNQQSTYVQQNRDKGRQKSPRTRSRRHREKGSDQDTYAPMPTPPVPFAMQPQVPGKGGGKGSQGFAGQFPAGTLAPPPPPPLLLQQMPQQLPVQQMNAMPDYSMYAPVPAPPSDAELRLTSLMGALRKAPEDSLTPEVQAEMQKNTIQETKKTSKGLHSAVSDVDRARRAIADVEASRAKLMADWKTFLQQSVTTWQEYTTMFQRQECALQEKLASAKKELAEAKRLFNEKSQHLKEDEVHVVSDADTTEDMQTQSEASKRIHEGLGNVVHSLQELSEKAELEEQQAKRQKMEAEHPVGGRLSLTIADIEFMRWNHRIVNEPDFRAPWTALNNAIELAYETGESAALKIDNVMLCKPKRCHPRVAFNSEVQLIHVDHDSGSVHAEILHESQMKSVDSLPPSLLPPPYSVPDVQADPLSLAVLISDTGVSQNDADRMQFSDQTIEAVRHHHSSVPHSGSNTVSFDDALFLFCQHETFASQIPLVGAPLSDDPKRAVLSSQGQFNDADIDFLTPRHSRFGDPLSLTAVLISPGDSDLPELSPHERLTDEFHSIPARIAQEGINHARPVPPGQQPFQPPAWIDSIFGLPALQVLAPDQIDAEGLLIRTWFLHHQHVRRWHVPRFVELDRVWMRWQDELLVSWRDMIQPGEVVHFHHVLPDPDRSFVQRANVIADVIVSQGTNSFSGLITIYRDSRPPSALAVSLPAEVSGVHLAEAMDSDRHSPFQLCAFHFGWIPIRRLPFPTHRVADGQGFVCRIYSHSQSSDAVSFVQRPLPQKRPLPRVHNEGDAPAWYPFPDAGGHHVDDNSPGEDTDADQSEVTQHDDEPEAPDADDPEDPAAFDARHRQSALMYHLADNPIHTMLFWTDFEHLMQDIAWHYQIQRHDLYDCYELTVRPPDIPEGTAPLLIHFVNDFPHGANMVLILLDIEIHGSAVDPNSHTAPEVRRRVLPVHPQP
eukprot:s2_g27.t1